MKVIPTIIAMELCFWLESGICLYYFKEPMSLWVDFIPLTLKSKFLQLRSFNTDFKHTDEMKSYRGTPNCKRSK